MNKYLSRFFIGVCLLIMASCEQEPQPVKVTGITVNPTSLSLVEGETSNLVATISPKDADNQSVIWSSNDGSIASVNNGKVTALKAGSTTITAKSDDGGFTASCSVTVVAKTIEVSSISLSKTELTLTEGDSETITATVKPDDATDKTVTWSSSDTAIATVEDGKITAVKEGIATVSAYAGNKTTVCMVTVKKKVIAVESIRLNMTSLSLTIGETETLSVVIEPANATDSLVWYSSDSSVATIQNGLVTAVAQGTTIIEVRAGAVWAACSVKVWNPYTFAYVDLGLSVKWANANLGAIGIEDSGDYYAWGETEPYYTAEDSWIWKEGKTGYNWESYRWRSSDNEKIIKYCTNEKYWGGDGSPDGKSVLELEDDAAHAVHGGSWRMPTEAEWRELINGCTWTWTTESGVDGYRATSKTNGNSIFLPIGGGRFDDHLSLFHLGFYWSSSLTLFYPLKAYCIVIGNGKLERNDVMRYDGYSIRPVSD